MAKEILSIPNKKVNYSPHYRNYLPGQNVEFKPVDNRVEDINAIGGSGTKIITSDTEPIELNIGDYWLNTY